MTPPTAGDEHTTRRRYMLATAGTVTAALAGCTGAAPTGTTTDDAGSGEGAGGSSSLNAGGSSTVYPITSDGASVWNYNPPASDTEYWPHDEYGIDTEQNLSDYWAGLYGFDAGSDGNPPFRVSVALSHSGVGLEKVQKGQIDIGDASAPVEAELTDLESYDAFVDHVVGVDAQPIVVSKAVYDAGVTQLSAETVRGMYTGEVTDWADVEGYEGESKEIQTIGRAVGSGTDTSFRANMLGSPDAKMPGVDVRKGENQQVATLVKNSDNAIAYMALAFVGDDIPAVALSFDDTVYEPGKNLADKDYPLSRDLHCYTYEGTSKKEAAFLRMLISEFGQDTFVGPAGYAKLNEARREEELAKLPESDS